jgi:hypothetical protein
MLRLPGALPPPPPQKKEERRGEREREINVQCPLVTIIMYFICTEIVILAYSVLTMYRTRHVLMTVMTVGLIRLQVWRSDVS